MVSIFLFFFSLAIYLKFIFPTFALGDAALLSTASVTLGIAHPPGYPLFSLAGKIAQLILPLSSPAWRLNFLNAIFMASAIAITTLSLKKLGINKTFSLIAGISLALAKAVIGNSLATEVYSLNLFFLSLIFYFILQKRWFLAVLLYGLSLANHYIMFLYLPIFFFYFLKEEKFSPKKFLFCLTLMLLGWLVYFYLPLRSVTSPSLNWGKPANWFYFSQHIKRSHFQALEFASSVSFREKIRFSLYFFKESVRQFPGGVGVLALLGLGLGIFSKKRGEFLLLIWVYLVTGLGLIWSLNFSFSLVNRYRFEPYLLPSWWALSIALAWILKESFKLTGKYFSLKIIIYSVFYFLLALSSFNILKTGYFASKSYLAYDLGENILSSLPANSILFTKGGNSAFALYYLTKVESQRPDLKIYDQGGVIFTGFLTAPLFKITLPEWEARFKSREKELILRENQPVYYMQEPSLLPSTLWQIVSRGLVYQAVFTNDLAKLPQLTFRDRCLATEDFWLNYERSSFYLKIAEYYESAQKLNLTSNYLGEAQKVAEDILSIQEKIGLMALKIELPLIAVKAYRQALRVAESDQAHARLAYALLQVGSKEEALTEIKTALSLNSQNALARKLQSDLSNSP